MTIDERKALPDVWVEIEPRPHNGWSARGGVSLAPVPDADWHQYVPVARARTAIPPDMPPLPREASPEPLVSASSYHYAAPSASPQGLVEDDDDDQPLPPVAERELVRTAPETIYLQIGEDDYLWGEKFGESYRDEITWCEDSCLMVEVKYVRADIATARTQAALREAQKALEAADMPYLIDRTRDCYDGIPLGVHVTAAPVALLVLIVDALEKIDAARKVGTTAGPA